MKKAFIVLAVVLMFGAAISYAQQNLGMMGGQGGWYCPYSGQWMGPGMMGKGMMGPCMGGQGMMGGHGMTGPGMMGQGHGQQQQLQKPLEEKDARAILENYIANMKNPNLQLGKIKDAGLTFEAEILTKDNSLVDKIMVDKKTGWMRSAY